MTTKKNLVKKVLMSALTAGIFATSLTACSDEDDVLNNMQNPDTAAAVELARSLGNLPATACTLPVEVKAEGQWRLAYAYDADGRGLVGQAYPKKGSGNATVKLHVSRNDSGHERYGEMYVISTLTGDTLQRLPMTQQAAPATRADALETSNRIYGAGYGYNTVTGKMAPTPIVYTEDAIAEKVLVEGGVEARFSIREYTASCFSQLCNNLQADASFSGKSGGFAGEISASFDMKNFKESNKDYVMSKIDATVSTSNFEANQQSIAMQWITDEAYDAINGLPIAVVGKGGSKRNRYAETKYPSNDEGFKKLINDYGTHFIRSCKLGGSMTYATTIDLSKVEDEYNLSAFAKCSYNNSAINASAGVKDSLTAKFKRSSTAISTKLSLHGGNKDCITNLQNKDNDNNMDAWMKSLQKGENTMMVNLNEAELIPLYELVNRQSRADSLKEYMTSGRMERHFRIDDQKTTIEAMGVIPHIKNIKNMFNTDLNYTGTLIKDLYVGGTLVARACLEFIPKFSMEERSIVIYPVCDNFAKYNMGFFIGNNAWKPQYVCFLDNGEFISTPATSFKVGAVDELYMCGSAFFAPDDLTIKNATESKPQVTAKDAYMVGKNYTNEGPGAGSDFIHNYPIVKIFNRIWSRAEYKEVVGKYFGAYNADGIKKFSIENWYVASTSDYENLFNGLKKANVSLPAQYMSNVHGGKDLTGFNIEWNNGWFYQDRKDGKNGDRMLYLTGTRQANGDYSTFRFVEFDKYGKGDFMPAKYAAKDVKHYLSVRMTQPLKMQIPKK